MNRHEKLKALLQEIKDLFPELDPVLGSVSLTVRAYATPEVNWHGIKEYGTGSELMRELGVDRRHKQVYPEGRCVLSGAVDGINYTAFVGELPPTCRIETVTEKVPKQQTVDTGEFIEIPRTKVVCTGAVEE